jgi:hypothetical protein
VTAGARLSHCRHWFKQKGVRLFKHAVVVCARWETAYISEWIRYYDAIGFDRIYLYCNDDDPTELAEQVARTPVSHPDLVSFTHFRGQGQQRAMYFDALVRVRREAEWVSFLDVDEFLHLPGCGNIKTFMAGLEDKADSVHFQWINFGNSGFEKRPSGSVLSNYTRRQADIHTNTKHLSRVSGLDEGRIADVNHPFWHGLFDPAWSNFRRVTVLGDDIAPLATDISIHLRAYLDDPHRAQRILQTGVINHYLLKSVEDFNIRAQRGLGGEFGGQQIWQRQFETGGYKAILHSMNRVLDTRLRDFAAAKGLAPTPSVKAASGPVHRTDGGSQTVRVRHAAWASDIVLGSDGRAHQVEQGALGSYQKMGDMLYIDWDSSPRDIFVRSGDEFVLSLLAPVA